MADGKHSASRVEAKGTELLSATLRVFLAEPSLPKEWGGPADFPSAQRNEAAGVVARLLQLVEQSGLKAVPITEPLRAKGYLAVGAAEYDPIRKEISYLHNRPTNYQSFILAHELAHHIDATGFQEAFGADGMQQWARVPTKVRDTVAEIGSAVARLHFIPSLTVEEVARDLYFFLAFGPRVGMPEINDWMVGMVYADTLVGAYNGEIRMPQLRGSFETWGFNAASLKQIKRGEYR